MQNRESQKCYLFPRFSTPLGTAGMCQCHIARINVLVSIVNELVKPSLQVYAIGNHQRCNCNRRPGR